jgi:DNA-binding beta-propeller fold protein YncE
VLKVCERPESAAYDAKSDAWYVSCQVKSDVPGDGFVAKLSADASTIVTEKFITGLDEPKGIAFKEGKLFVSNVHELVTADLASGMVLSKVTVNGTGPLVPMSPFLNDVAVDEMTGEVYVSDNRNNVIVRFNAEGATPEVFASGPELEAPNGLLVDRRDSANPRLLVAGMGPGLNASKGVTDKLGTVYALPLSATATSSDAGTGLVVKHLTPRIGNLDGLALDGDDFLVTDFFAGRLMRVRSGTDTPVFNEGDAKILRQSFQRAADLGINTAKRLIVVPETNNGAFVAIDLATL